VRIAVVGPAHPYKGGAAQHTTVLAHRLSAAGHDTMLVSWRAQYPKLLYPGQLTVAEPEAELYPGMERPLAWYRPDSWWRTGRRLGRQGCDVVVLTVVTPVQAPAYLTLARAARAGGCTVVALCHNVLPHESRGADEPLMRALLRQVDAVVVHSTEQAALAETLTAAPVQVAALPPHLPHGGPAPAGIPFTPAGTALATPAGPATPARLATPDTPARPAVAEAPGPRHRLLFFGIVRPYKGLDILLRALAEAGPQVSLTVAGEIWDGQEELLRLIAGLGLQDRVTMPGGYVPTAEVPGVFATADALVLPYRSATASQNALLAFQFGIPVIASRAGAIADAVEDGVNGILCAPGDAGDLARAIRALYAPGTLERLRAGVRPPDPGPLWDDYLAAVGKAFPAGRSMARDGRFRRGSLGVVPPSQGHKLPNQDPSAAGQAPLTAAQAPLTAGAVPGPGRRPVVGRGRCAVPGRRRCAVTGRGRCTVLRRGRSAVLRRGRRPVAGRSRCAVPGRGRRIPLDLPGAAHGRGPGAVPRRSGGAALDRARGPAARRAPLAASAQPERHGRPHQVPDRQHQPGDDGHHDR
jgi:glycosyltransferase involved in cell wall biosynthesis